MTKRRKVSITVGKPNLSTLFSVEPIKMNAICNWTSVNHIPSSLDICFLVSYHVRGLHMHSRVLRDSGIAFHSLGTFTLCFHFYPLIFGSGILTSGVTVPYLRQGFKTCMTFCRILPQFCKILLPHVP